MSSTGDKPDKPTDEVLIRVWENERNSRNFAVKLMWENMKYFSILIGSLLTAYTALLGYISTNPISFAIYSIAIFNIMILFPIPAFIIVLALYARNDLIERRRRFLLVVTHLLKLEQLLGLHQKMGDRLEYFKADEYLFAEYRNNLSQGESKKNFIDFHMSEKPSTFKAMQNVYIIFIVIAVVLILFGIIVLFFPSVLKACNC